MRTWNIVCGVAVLVLTVHFTHFLHRFLVNPTWHTPAFWAGTAAPTVVWILSFVGGCLLLRRGR